MAYKLLRLPDVKEKVALSRTTIYTLIKQGKFPKPVKVTEKSSAWVLSELDEWLESKINERDGEAKAV